jgi:MoxR-like ATPase
MPKSFCQRCRQPFEVPPSVSDAEVICPLCGKLTALSFDPTPTTFRPKLTIPPVEPPKVLTLPEVATVARQLIENVERVIVGKHSQVTLAAAVLLAEGHLLVEDVPGVAKTMLARALAVSAGCTFKRIQCTPDLQPSDIMGDTYLDPQTGRTEFRFGPLFSQIVLVDEINRASPRTQAALLEAMGEAMVTMERVTYRLQRPFMVIATQNPIEHEGTFLLPEAQKDRFLVRLTLGYPALADEKQMVERFQLKHPIDSLLPVTNPDRIIECQQAVREVRVASEVSDYILALTQATRRHPALALGASPRGSLGLFRAAQALAAIQGKDTATAAQVREMVPAVLTHRLIVRQEPPHQNLDPAEVIQVILDKTPPPG